VLICVQKTCLTFCCVSQDVAIEINLGQPRKD
jgi:hypothetical protein